MRPNTIDDLRYLCACLEEVDLLEGRTALEALAAFLRARIDASGTATPILLGPGVLSLVDLMAALDKFVAGDGEGGRVGQAAATAILDLVFDEVRTKAINDPSSKWPGDVGVFLGTTQTLSVEVRQRPIADSEVLLFAQRLQEATIQRAIVVALDQGSTRLDREQIAFQARRLYAVELLIYLTASDLLRDASRWAADDVPLLLGRFPRRMVERMQELGVSSARLEEWTTLFAVPTP